jgi:hypothetical protein
LKLALLVLVPVFFAACATPGLTTDERHALACGRIRIVANGEEMAWGAAFDRPTPELYHAESRRFVSRIALAGGGPFAEAVERDGTFCWRLGAGTYFVSRIVPFQNSAPARPDDPSAIVFPGVAFKLDEGTRAAYVGTLRIRVSVSKRLMGQRRIVDEPSIEVVDEFDRDRSLAKSGRAVELRKNLMVRIPELEGVPFHPEVPELPALLRDVPWFLFMPRR